MSVVEVENRGNIAVITIANPPVNALSQPVRAGLAASLQRIDKACETDACVLRCDGRTFIAGADIREFGKPPQEPHLPDVVMRLDAMQKPVVAAIHGTALGGGLEVAMGCHHRVAVHSARVGLPEVNLGLLPGAGGTQLLPRLVGVERALEIMLSGKPVTAPAALEYGLLDKVVDDGCLVDEAVRYAQAIAGDRPRRTSVRVVEPVDPQLFDEYRQRTARRTRGLISPQKIIDCVQTATRTSLADGLQVERQAFIECRESPQSEGLRHAFFAERKASNVPELDRNAPTRNIQNVAIVGAGTMGIGIAHSCLSAGCSVVLLDKSVEGVQRGAQAVQELFAAGIERGKVTDSEARTALERLTTGTDLDKAAAVDLVIEAVFEDLAIKKNVFARLGRTCRNGAVLATNTSTLDVDAIASASGRPADVVGLHFFSPAHIMRLLEIVRGRETSQEVLATALALARRLGKIGVVVGNCTGFVGNRMLYSYGRESQLMLLEGAPPQQIDRALTDWGMAMGPHAVGDLAGLDVGYKARRQREDLPDDPRFYRIADLLVERGRLGRKTGRGMYRYENDAGTPEPDPDVQQLIDDEAARLGVQQRRIDDSEIVERCIFALVTEGARILEEGIATRASDIDVIWINGYGFPRHRGGPMHFADTVGPAAVLEKITGFAARFGDRYWRPPALLERLARNGGRFDDIGN